MAARAEALEFAHRVLRCGVLRGLEAAAFWASPGVLWIQVRHPYGPWKTVRLTGIVGGLARSEHGTPVTASDIAARLKNALKDRPPDRRIGHAWKMDEAVGPGPIERERGGLEREAVGPGPTERERGGLERAGELELDKEK